MSRLEGGVEVQPGEKRVAGNAETPSGMVLTLVIIPVKVKAVDLVPPVSVSWCSSSSFPGLQSLGKIQLLSSKDPSSSALLELPNNRACSCPPESG